MSDAARDPARLIDLARAGDGAAAGALLEQYRGYLRLLARVEISRRLQGKVDASDLVQETFLEAHRHLAGFRGATEGEVVVWLRQILASRLANTVRRYLGTRRRDVRLERDLETSLERSACGLRTSLLAPHSSPSQQVVRREEGVRLAEALARLPAHYREVLVLRHLEGLPFADVAARMGRSVDGVKNIWARALARVRRAFEEVP